MIDVNVSLSRWPFRRLPLDEPAALVAALHNPTVYALADGTYGATIAAGAIELTYV